jgi:hypothetical protein
VGNRRQRTNVDGDRRLGNDSATGAALHSGEKRNGSTLWSCARRARCPYQGCRTPPGRRSGRAAPTRGKSGVAGDPFDISVGGTNVHRITGHVTATQPSWMRGKPTTFGETRNLDNRVEEPGPSWACAALTGRGRTDERQQADR